MGINEHPINIVRTRQDILLPSIFVFNFIYVYRIVINIDRGYELIGKNWRTRFGEIDLIVKKGKTLVFVEVKARTGDWGQHEWQISQRKIAKVQKMAQVYLISKQPDYEDLRIDAVCILLDKNNKAGQIKHYQNPIL